MEHHWRIAAAWSCLVLCALVCTGPAEAQSRTWGRLTTHSGPSPYDWEIAQWIDDFFEDGNKGDGVVTSNILYIETQCFEQGADNFNAATGEATGDAATDTVSFTNTTYLGAQRPGVTSYYRGYHDDAAFALVPGRTAAQVHTAGADGRDSRELPRIRGDFFRKVGGGTSTHVLVWAGQPNHLDEQDVVNIALNFESHPNTTVDILYGDGSTGFGTAANSVGAATRANLRSKLQEIGALMDDGADEQFIFFVTDHGSSPYISAVPVTAPADTFGTTVDVEVPATALEAALADPSNQPTVTFTTSTDLNALDEFAVGFDKDGVEFFGYNSQSITTQLVVADGNLFYAHTFEVSESIFDVPRKGAAKTTVTQTFGMSNFTGQDIEFEHVIVDLGDIERPMASGGRKVLPAVARAPGSGVDFITRWNIANTGPNDTRIDMTYVPREDQSGQPMTVTVELPAGELVETDDPLADYFGLAAGRAIGAVEIRPTKRGWGDVRVHSTVIADEDGGDQFGQFFPTVNALDALSTGESVLFSTTHDASRYRVNAGVMALADNTRVLVEAVDPQDNPLAAGITLDLTNNQSSQINDLATTFGLEDRSDYLVRMTVQRGSATGYVSVLDGLGGSSGTSDPTTIFAERFSDTRVTLLELGSIQGQNEFSGSATITNRGSSPATVQADFHRRGTPGVESSETITLPGGSAVGFADFVDEVFGVQGDVGTVVLTPLSGGPIAATGREYAIFRNGGGAITGTAGQRIPGLLDEDLLTPGRIWHFIGLRQRQIGGATERSHLAMFNPGDEDVEITISMYGTTTGIAPLGTITRTVEAGELIQINNILNVVSAGQGGGVHRLELTTTGDIFAQAFRVNATGDPITIDAR
jgi:hypothetical protein